VIEHGDREILCANLQVFSGSVHDGADGCTNRAAAMGEVLQELRAYLTLPFLLPAILKFCNPAISQMGNA
jgi:hypothetical protein